MNPIKFKECNTLYAKDQPRYKNFPLYRTENDEGRVIGCWYLSFRERIRILFTGRIWHSMLTFHEPLQPQRLTTRKRDLIASLICIVFVLLMAGCASVNTNTNTNTNTKTPATIWLRGISQRPTAYGMIVMDLGFLPDRTVTWEARLLPLPPVPEPEPVVEDINGEAWKEIQDGDED